MCFAIFCFLLILFTLFTYKSRKSIIWPAFGVRSTQTLVKSYNSLCHCKLQIWQFGRVWKWTKELKSNCRFNNILERQKFLGNQSLLLLAIHRAVLPSLCFFTWEYGIISMSPVFPVFHDVEIVRLSLTLNANKHTLSKDLNWV